jgi:hypothetical protein
MYMHENLAHGWLKLQAGLSDPLITAQPWQAIVRQRGTQHAKAAAFRASLSAGRTQSERQGQ